MSDSSQQLQQIQERRLILLKEHFLSRTDVLGLKANGLIGPLYNVDEPLLDRLLVSHLTGERIRVSGWSRSMRRPYTAAWRGGSYTMDNDGNVRYLCWDIDGGSDHSLPLARVDEVSLKIVELCQAEGVYPFRELSGSGAGWHVWCFFNPAIPALEAQMFGQYIVSKLPEELLKLEKPYENKQGELIETGDIEVFPKQTARGKLGNMVFLPWWAGGKDAGR